MLLYLVECVVASVWCICTLDCYNSVDDTCFVHVTNTNARAGTFTFRPSRYAVFLFQPPGLTALWFYTTAFRLNLSEVLKVSWTFFMLCLVSGPSINTLPLTLSERSYSVSAGSPRAVA